MQEKDVQIEVGTTLLALHSSWLPPLPPVRKSAGTPLSEDEILFLIPPIGHSVGIMSPSTIYTFFAQQLSLASRASSRYQIGGVCEKAEHLLFFARDASCLLVMDKRFKISTIPLLTKLEEKNRLSDFCVTSAASNGRYHLLCDSRSGALWMLVDNAFKPVGRVESACEGEQKVETKAPRNGGPRDATLGKTIAVVSTKRSDSLFYALEPGRIRTVTDDSIVTLPLKAAAVDGVDPLILQNMCSIAVGSRGEIYAADSKLGSVVRIENGEVSKFQSFAPSPVALAMFPSKLVICTRLDCVIACFIPKQTVPDSARQISMLPTGLLHTVRSTARLPADAWREITRYLSYKDLMKLGVIPSFSPSLSVPAEHENPEISYIAQKLAPIAPRLASLTIEPPESPIPPPSGSIAALRISKPPTDPNLHHWLRGLTSLIIRMPITVLDYNPFLSAFPSLETLEIHDTQDLKLGLISPLPSGLRRLCLPQMTSSFAIYSLPPKLTYLDISSSPMMPEDFTLPATDQHESQTTASEAPVALLEKLATLIISSATLDDYSVRSLPLNLTRLDAERVEWTALSLLSALPQSITQLNARLAIGFTDAFASCLPPKLQDLDVGRSTVITNAFIRDLVIRCPQLRSLDVSHSEHISLHALPHLELLADLQKLHLPLQAMRDLQTEHISRLPRALEALDLRCTLSLALPDTSPKQSANMRARNMDLGLPAAGPSSSGSGLPQFRENIPSVPKNVLGGNSTWLPRNLHTLKLGNTDISDFSAFPATLTYLSLKQSQYVSSNALATTGKILPKLTYLNIAAARNEISPSVIDSLPRGLTNLSLPIWTQNLLDLSNFHPISVLPLRKLKLVTRKPLFSSAVFFLLPRTLETLYISHLASVDSFHWKLLPRDLLRLHLPMVTTATDTQLQALPRLLEVLDLSSATKISPHGLSSLQRLKTLSIGTNGGTLQRFASPTSKNINEALTALFAKLPVSLVDLSLPLYFSDPPYSKLEAVHFSHLANLKLLQIGHSEQYKITLPQSASAYMK